MQTDPDRDLVRAAFVTNFVAQPQELAKPDVSTLDPGKVDETDTMYLSRVLGVYHPAQLTQILTRYGLRKAHIDREVGRMVVHRVGYVPLLTPGGD